MQVDRETVEAARADPVVFAEALVREPLWPHQVDVARSPARVRAILSGRQAGKSRVLSVLALHEAFSGPDRRVLVISAGEDAAKELLAEVGRLVSSPFLAGSVVDAGLSLVTLTNGSSIRSVPASEKQVRGRSVDLLVIDEACFVSEEVWRASQYTIVARPGSRVLLASTPFGRRDRFMAQAWRAGEQGEPGYGSFRWPSTASPLVDEELLGMWRRTSTDRSYRAEVLAEWVDNAGAYFTSEELEGALDDYPLMAPETAGGRPGVAGVDWGFARDSSAVVVLGEARPGDLAVDRPGQRTFFLPWAEEAKGVPYSEFIRRVGQVADGYRLSKLATETNGVGQMPSQELRRLVAGRVGRVVEVATTAASKADGFGRIKLLLQQGRLVLPRHPGLLSQLGALEYEERDSGTTHIAVPERAGHDDLAMALCLAVGAGDVSSRSARASTSSVAGLRMPSVPAGRTLGGSASILGDPSGRSGGGGRRVWSPGDPRLQRLPGPHPDLREP